MNPLTTGDKQFLVARAVEAAGHAYAPYSHYSVGAALLAQSGIIYGGCNVENASYPASICGERSALVKAVSEGERRFVAIAIATRNAGSPCGICRQMLYEFAPHLWIILADLHGQIHTELLLSDLLPRGFGPDDLPR